MMRRGRVVLGALILFSAGRAAAAPVLVTVSGQTQIAILDSNKDGIPLSPTDCSFSATFNDPSLVITPVQDSSGPIQNKIQGCSGQFMATASLGQDSSSDFVTLNFTSAPGVVGTVLLPTVVEAIDEAPPAPDGPPLDISNLTVAFPGNENAGGLLCTAGGPAAQVTTVDGSRLLIPLSFYPSFEMPQYLKVPNLPVSNFFGDPANIDGYIPVTPDRRITVQVGTEEPIVDIDLDELAICPGGLGVPTATEWGLIGLMLGLLFLGSWAVSRRPGFAQALPL